MRTLILGAGAVGGYFGARLTAAGSNVAFLVRPPRAARLRAEGLRLTSLLGDCYVTPQVVTTDNLAGPVDLVVVACKAYDLDSAMAAVAPAVGPDTAILPLLNGIAHLHRLDAAFGRRRVLGGIAHLAVSLAPDGRILHLNGFHRLIAGTRSPDSPPVLGPFGLALTAAGVDFVAAEDIEQALWEKFVFLATLAGATCSLRASIGSILAMAGGEAFVQALLAECCSVAAACGRQPDPERLGAYHRQLTERDSTLTASMLRDIQRGGPTEGDHILGHLLRLAEERGLATPWLRLACSHLQAYEASRRGSPATR